MVELTKMSTAEIVARKKQLRDEERNNLVEQDQLIAELERRALVSAEKALVKKGQKRP